MQAYNLNFLSNQFMYNIFFFNFYSSASSSYLCFLCRRSMVRIQIGQICTIWKHHSQGLPVPEIFLVAFHSLKMKMRKERKMGNKVLRIEMDQRFFHLSLLLWKHVLKLLAVAWKMKYLLLLSTLNLCLSLSFIMLLSFLVFYHGFHVFSASKSGQNIRARSSSSLR